MATTYGRKETSPITGLVLITFAVVSGCIDLSRHVSLVNYLFELGLLLIGIALVLRNKDIVGIPVAVVLCCAGGAAMIINLLLR